MSEPIPAVADYLIEQTITALQAAMQQGKLTARELVVDYIARIEALDQAGPTLRAVIEVNPEALTIAEALDAERATSGPRGPLHGIPILLKDNIDTADPMLTTAGSLALMTSRPTEDAFIVKQLRAAGAVILGKTNLSEWANFRSIHSTSGWSGRGGQTKNPYILDRNPCGSSSGSGVAVSANLSVVAIGTETDGSIVCPSAASGIVGIKPTVGLTSRTGVIPISHSQDTIGPMARTVRDAAIVLGSLTGIDPQDATTAASEGHFQTDYTQFLEGHGLHGARLGVARKTFFGRNAQVDQLMEGAIEQMRAAGAIIIDPADIPTAETIAEGKVEFQVLLYEFKHDLKAYLAKRVAVEPTAEVPRTLADLIAFNRAHAEAEMPFFEQELFEAAESKGPLTDASYVKALAMSHQLSRDGGIDAVLQRYQLDALIAPTVPPAWVLDHQQGDTVYWGSSSPAAMAGYPLITVPAGQISGLPVNLTFMGTAYSEPTLIKLAYAFEQLTQARRPPKFLPQGVE